MNWTLILPELVLSLAGLGLLVAGVIPKREIHFPIAMGTLAALLAAAALTIAQADGVAFGGLYIADAFSRFGKLLVLAGWRVVEATDPDLQHRSAFAGVAASLSFLLAGGLQTSRALSVAEQHEAHRS